MFRLSKSRKDKQERAPVDVCEPPRPRIINGLKRRASNTIRSVAIPQVVVRTPRLSVIKATGPRFSEDSSYTDCPATYSASAPWQLQRSTSGSDDGYQIPGYFHRSLPREVYDCIVTQLEQMHLDQDRACASCYLEDLHSLSLTSRTWGKAANAVMYRKVLVLANEEHGALPRLKVKGTSRLKLLRRTLRENSTLAQQVKELHLSDFQTLYQNATIEQEEILNLVASLVMACPRLERLVGFHVPFSTTFDRLSYALSTRSNLRERTWIFDNTDIGFHEEDEDEIKGHYVAECDPTERFLDLNSNHLELSTLVLHQGPDNFSSPLNFRAIIGTCRSFPQLRNLSITGLPASAFTNLVLNALPANLRSLRLGHLPGVTEKGIQRFAKSTQAKSIQRLTLINLEISSVLTFADILSPYLACLEEFSLIQNNAPTLREQDPTPIFHSPLLHYLHWELRSEASPLPAFTVSSPSSIESPESSTTPSVNPESSCDLGTSILAASIRDNKFPSLRRIRVPHDPQGTIQSLCKPLATALLLPDISKLAFVPRTASSTGSPRTSNESAPGSPLADEMTICTMVTGTRVDSVVNLPRIRSPTTIVATEGVLAPIRSRLAAQSRILAARNKPGMVVRVIDPEGNAGVDRVFGSYIGDLRSEIMYELKPDEGIVGPTGWVTDMNDLMSCRAEGDEDALECTWGPCGHVLHAGVSSKSGMVDDLF